MPQPAAAADPANAIVPQTAALLARLSDLPPLGHGKHDALDEGVCACGCGAPAPIARRTSAKGGVVRGQRLRFVSGHNKRRAPDLSRFLPVEHGFRTPCWDWTGPKTRKGYGRIQVGGVHRQAHAVAYEATRGPIPAGFVLDHLCRNRGCIRPDHLEAVPVAVNTRRGALAKLNPSKVEAIRADERPHSQIARDFGVSRQTIGLIKNGRRWAALALVERMIAAQEAA